jgi:hypothetical protein
MRRAILAPLPIVFVLALSVPGSAQPEEEPELIPTLRALTDHVTGAAPLGEERVREHGKAIREGIEGIGASAEVVEAAIELVRSYDANVGPLFINDATSGGIPRKPEGGLELHRALLAVQQGLIDHAYTPENLERFGEILDGAAFGTSAYFPGAVPEEADPDATHQVQINASHPPAWGIPVMYREDPARRPTGCYLAPGDIATVTVPPELVGQGFSVRVGAHSWDLTNKPRILRLDRVSLVYPIDSADTPVANPLGGGIYIEVPYEAEQGVITIEIRGAVRSPFFSARSFDQTTLEEWREVERHHPGPWADFESGKFMMQVPTEWIYQHDDPVTLMGDWDTALDCVSDLFGLPRTRSKTVLYLQVDVVLRGGANFPGYPQSNFRYSPTKLTDGRSNHWILRGPQHGGEIIFHELGHSQLFTKFRGEVEAVVNLPYVSVLNKGFGVDLDTAFGRSFSNENISLDQAAIMWMVTQNFRDGKPMDISNSERNEVRYQHRGYGKYVEIVNLFGWEALEDFWHSVQLDYLDGIEYPRNSDPTDSRILRMSRAAGADLTPLIHFWGVHPEDPEALKRQMAEAGLQPSPLIHDRLLHYLTLIPMSGEEFAEHAHTIYPEGTREANPLYGVGWYHVWLPKYEESHGRAARAALQDIIDTYFPEGRPEGP